MTLADGNSQRVLKRTHQQLLRDWRRKKGLCIVCAEREGNELDHLPPKVLFPASLRTPETDLFTFPVCKKCNKSSSDEDFLMSFVMSMQLNQESIINDQEPTDPDLLALYGQTQGHLHNPEEVKRRIGLLKPFFGTDPCTGMPAIQFEKLSINQTLTKIVKSIYWLYTGGDILQQYNPGWWIGSEIDTSKKYFIESHLNTGHADLYWGDRFITHHEFGKPEDGTGGIILCSLHFYTKRQLGKGLSWLVFASPTKTIVNDKSLYESSVSVWGAPTIEPQI